MDLESIMAVFGIVGSGGLVGIGTWAVRQEGRINSLVSVIEERKGAAEATHTFYTQQLGSIDSRLTRIEGHLLDLKRSL